jgi:hypothetical protein
MSDYEHWFPGSLRDIPCQSASNWWQANQSGESATAPHTVR